MDWANLMNNPALTSMAFLFLLVFARVLPITLIATGSLTRSPAPKTISLAISFVTALLLAPALWAAISPADLFVALGPTVVLREICIGVWLGAALGLLFLSLKWSGGIFDLLFAGHARHPGSGPMGGFLPVFGVALFLLAGGHQLILNAVVISYIDLPIITQISTDATSTSAILAIADLFSDAMRVAVLIALPILGFALLLHLIDALFQTAFGEDRDQPATEQLKRLVLLGLFLSSLQWTAETFLEWAPATFHQIEGALRMPDSRGGG